MQAAGWLLVACLPLRFVVAHRPNVWDKQNDQWDSIHCCRRLYICYAGAEESRIEKLQRQTWQCVPHSDPKTCWIVCQKREYLVCNWFRWLNLNLPRCWTFFDRKRRRSSTLSSSVIYDRTEDQALRPHLFIFMLFGAGDVINLILSRRERSEAKSYHCQKVLMHKVSVNVNDFLLLPHIAAATARHASLNL